MPVEIYDVVDEDDKIIGKASREEVHKNNRLIHRSVVFFVFDKKGRVFVNQRSKNKEFYREYWSLTFGGHVNSGETYEEAVVREAKEEAGIEGKPFFMGTLKIRLPTESENSKIFGFITDKKLKLDPFEVKQGKFMTMKELEEKLKKDKFLPKTKDLLNIVRNFQASNY
jgi:isopentenyl-diphosphate delta-isomerase